MPVTRNKQWIDREFGAEKWPLVERLIEAETQRGGTLSQVVARVARSEAYPDRSALDEEPATFGGSVVDVPVAVAFWGYQSLVTETVLGTCDPETDLIVELGAGWGRNLFLLWSGGGPSDARYVAAEYTESGRRAATRLAELAPDLDFAAIPFDYYAADLSSIRGARRAVVFSSYSVDQIPELPASVLDEIAGVADEVVCVQIEPFGWQTADQEGRVGSSEEYARAHDYNRNLADVVTAAASDGRLVIDYMRTELVGINPQDSASVVIWHSAAAE